jgi:stage V sporulation protein R
MFYNTNLPPHLRVLKDEIEGYAREYGLDFYETIFEVVDADDLNEIAAYGGFPTRYPHWSFGMAYEELKKGYDYGLSKIYEMVINNDPCYAYLMRCNHTVDQKLVMAHVYGHCDFFKNNAYFGHTNRKMMDEIANHGARIRRYEERFGVDEVESFVDRCMSLDDLIDIHSTAIKRRDDHSRYDFTEKTEETPVTKFKSKAYMDEYINPRANFDAEEEKRKASPPVDMNFPERPEKDVLLFLIEHAPLKAWQRDVLAIIRDEAYYFTPQGQTKIANEGWACLEAGSLIPTDQGFLDISELARDRRTVTVHDGELGQGVYDWAVLPDRETTSIMTSRGLKLSGSSNHRVLLPDGTWKQLSQLRIGDRVRLAVGSDLWATQQVRFEWSPSLVKPCAIITLSAQGALEKSEIDQELQRIPDVVDLDLAEFLGLSSQRSEMEEAEGYLEWSHGTERVAELLVKLFGIEPELLHQPEGDVVRVRSSDLNELMNEFGMSKNGGLPNSVLRSPKSVVLSYLRGLIKSSTAPSKVAMFARDVPERSSEQLQLLLLNLGVLSHRFRSSNGSDLWHLFIEGPSCTRLARLIGSSLPENGFNESTSDEECDEVVSIQPGRAPVYDISVRETHRYAAQGFINHNSYWHSTIMTQKVLDPSEVIDYADHHSGTMATSGKRLNPYKLGIELLRDIEFRWNTGRFGPEYDNCDDLEKKRNWNLNLGLGRKKIFEVRRVHNDITFIDTFLTPEFCIQHKLFSFAYADQSKQYLVESREFEMVKQRLLFSLTNFGKPWIYVVNGNHRNRGELLLKHEYNGIELKMAHAQDTLTNIQFMWGRPVHIETVVDNKPTLLSFDGSEHTKKVIGETNDKPTAPAKTK